MSITWYKEGTFYPVPIDYTTSGTTILTWPASVVEALGFDIKPWINPDRLRRKLKQHHNTNRAKRNR